MTISQKAWRRYLDGLRKVNDAAAGQMADYLRTHSVETQEEIQAALDFAYALSTKYGEGATELACEMYDAMAEASGAMVPPAVPAETATYGEVAKAVRGAMKQSQNPDLIGSAVGRQVKTAGVDTTMKNALRDGAEWAWIPAGDTCAFCLTLASRGWQKASKKALRNGHAEHIHANCDCTYAVRFDGKSTVAGYDPDALLEQYYAAGDTPQERINAMRRAQYAKNKDVINAQKRAAYAERKEYYFREELIKSGFQPLDEDEKNGIINIEIDELTPCLRDNKTGELVDTTIGIVKDRKALKGFNKKTGWYINWQQVPDDCTIMALRVKGNSEIQGLVAYKKNPDAKAIEGHWAVANPKSNKKVADQPQYSGIGGHLFAIMADASFKADYDGYVIGRAANAKLLQHYGDSFGAKQLRGLDFYIDTEAAQQLIEKYTWESA